MKISCPLIKVTGRVYNGQRYGDGIHGVDQMNYSELEYVAPYGSAFSALVGAF